MATNFDVVGSESFGELGKFFTTEIQKQVDLASKAATNQSADLVTYGRTKSINAKNSTSSSIVSRAARTLLIPKEHIYYRTFVRGLKVSYGANRGAKPYASVMLRANSINVADLLVNGSEAKKMYGFTTRKRSNTGRIKPNLRSKKNRNGRITVAGRTYTDTFLADGSHRDSTEGMDEHYMTRLGAKAFKIKGKYWGLFQKKDPNQKLPYTSKMVRINEARVLRVLRAAAEYSISINGDGVEQLQSKEIDRRFKKLGLKVT